MHVTCSWLISFLQGCLKKLFKALSEGSAVQTMVCLNCNSFLGLELLLLLQERPKPSIYLPQHDTLARSTIASALLLEHASKILSRLQIRSIVDICNTRCRS